jgi:hypothetical protein
MSGVRVRSAIMLFFCAASVALAQNTNSAEIRGTVTDATGSVIPGVSVTILNVDIGVSKQLTTNDSGLYEAVSILSGRYRITFTKEGFGSLVRDGIDLRVGVFSVDARLAVGTASQQVEVTAEATLLKTETGEQATSLQSESMAQLPQVGENWANFTKLLPGVSGSGTGVSVNGNLPYYSTFLADGGVTTLPHSANVDVSIFETVAEVQINTSSFSAQYGVGGAVFNQISKGGTNKFHGAGYEYFQNNALNARSFFSSKVANLRYDNFGGSVGGPILKNKMFFYFNYDQTVNRTVNYPFYTFPTADEKNGNFSNPIFPTLYDPNTMNAQGQRTPFPGNTIPANRIDPVAAKIQALFPNPNLPGFANNFQGPITGITPFKKFFGRLDYNVTDRNRITGSVTERDNPGHTYSPVCPVNCYAGDVASFNGQVTDVWTISPTIVNEVRFAYTRQGNYFTPDTLGGGYPAKLGINYGKADVFPNISINGSVSGNNTLQSGTNAIYAENSFDPSDVLTMIKGRHVLKFGVEILAVQDNSTPWGNIQSAALTFNGVFTKQSPTSTAPQIGYADFLLGQVQSWGANNTPIVGARQKTPQFFAQDDFKVRPNLTLNLGLRYEWHRGWSEVGKRLAVFDPNIVNPVSNSLGATWFQGDHGRDTLEAPVHVFLPRIGFSWAVRPKWAVRGGFGIYAYGWSVDTYAGVAEGVGTNSQGSLTNVDQLKPVFVLSDPNPPLNYVGPSRSPAVYNGQSVGYAPYHTPVPRNYQWNFSIEREMPFGMVGELAYVGSHGQDLSFPVNINQIPLSRLGPGTTAQIQANRPYPQYSGINGDMFNALSNYNSVQLSLRKRFTNGISYDANYTYSKFLDTQDSAGWGGRGGTQYYQDAFNPARNYGYSNLDIPHALRGDVVYQLPFGVGKRYVSQPGLFDALIGGWQASVIFVATSGTPYTPIFSSNSSTGAQAGTLYPNLVGDPNLSNPTLRAWYNKAAFAKPALYTFGNSGRNILRGPKMTDVDFSLGKSFHVPRLEGSALQIRIDATNVLNHPSFANPNNTVDAANAGVISGTTVGGRNIQLGARFYF